MRVVFLEDVPGVAQGGDVKEVKNGFGRNYLIPKNLAVPVTHNALQRVEGLKIQAQTARQRWLDDVKALAQELDGVQVNVEMRAGAGGRLYGSVTNILLAEELSKRTGRPIDRRVVELAEPIRQLGIFDVGLRLHPEAKATIKVLVHATGTEPTAPAAVEAAEAEVDEPVNALVEDAAIDAQHEAPEAIEGAPAPEESSYADGDEDEPR